MPEFIRPSIRAMQGYQPGEQPLGASKVIKLNTNENPYPPSPKVMDAIQKVLTDDYLRKYPDPIGVEFRQTASSVLGVPFESIVIGNGSDEILSMLVRAMVPEGGVIVAPTPSYILYKSLAQIQGARYHEIPFEQDWTLNSRKLQGVGHLTFIPNPNSPTGTFINPETLVNWPTPLVLDEAYVEFADATGSQFVADHPHLIVTRTFSKAYSLAGIRFGFAIAHPRVADQLYKVKDSYNCDVLALAAATAAISDQEYLQTTRNKILHTRAQLAKSLQELGFTIIPSHSNFIWCQHPNHFEKKIYEELKSRQILVRYFDYPSWGTGLRISVGTDEQTSILVTELKSILMS
ncbi:MAG TPA: histidinol-phosphate transaminase [Gemmatales bacterium]|nr:histidinol-phosphate transaminase [Gemmatales bacterium]HMP15666.1 histidinol-phosphate transaminase [Gemmatales bacterium]